MRMRPPQLDAHFPCSEGWFAGYSGKIPVQSGFLRQIITVFPGQRVPVLHTKPRELRAG
jgi:hypothetical protein